MALPKLSIPTFEMTVPSTKQKIKYRPFLVKEEKILLMALEGEDKHEMANALKQIINNCCLDDIDINKLTPFDLEYFFLLLRAKSIGETIDMIYDCQNKKGKKDCDNTINFSVDIDKVKMEENPEHTNKIDLTDTVGVIMKYPELDVIVDQNFNNQQDWDTNKILNVVVDCMESIHDESNVYKMKDINETETIEFLEGLTQPQFIKIRQFFDTMPKIKYEQTLICDKCKKENKIKIEGMHNFFG